MSKKTTDKKVTENKPAVETRGGLKVRRFVPASFVPAKAKAEPARAKTADTYLNLDVHKFPTDKHNLCVGLKEQMRVVASRIGTDPANLELLDTTYAILRASVQERFEYNQTNTGVLKRRTAGGAVEVAVEAEPEVQPVVEPVDEDADQLALDLDGLGLTEEGK